VTGTRKIEANRKNARASTGPKTAQGRARVARNALRVIAREAARQRE
jgi:hypothetical protein